MYYEINVSLNGSHFFATSKRSIKDIHQAKRVLTAIVNKFPLRQGYKVTISKYDESGIEFDSKKFLSNDL